MYRRRPTAQLAVVLVMCLCLGGCLSKTTDSVTQDLNDALTTLDQQSISWQATLTTLEDKLHRDGSDLVQQVGQLLDASIQAAGIESRCTVDFIGHRARDVIHNLLQLHLHKATIPPDPHVCTTNPPGDLQLTQVLAGTVTHLDIDGYDLVRADGFTLATTNRAGQSQPVDAQFIGNPSPYLITVNLSLGNGYRIPNDTQKIVFSANGKFVGDMNVEAVPPPPPPPPRVTVSGLTVAFHTNDDDKDGNSHLTVQLETAGGQLLAGWAQQGDLTLHDHTDFGPVALTPGTVDRAQLVGAALNICIAPVGNDTWRFDVVLQGHVSDGTIYAISQQSLQLTQDNRCFRKALG